MGVSVSSSHTVSTAPLSSHSSPAPAWGPSQGRGSSRNFSNMSPSHGLQFFTNCFSVGPSHGEVLQEQTAPVWVPRGVRSPASKPALVWTPLSTGPQVLAEACSSGGSPRGHSPLQASTCSGVGSSMGCRSICGPPRTSMGCRGTACLSMVCSTSCRGISALTPAAPPPPPSSQTLVFAELFLSHILTLLFWLLFCSIFFPFLKYLIPVTLPSLLLMDLALARGGSVWSHLALALLDMGEASGSFQPNPPL